MNINYNDFKSLNFWKTKRKLEKLDNLISRMRADAVIKSERIDNLILSLKKITDKVSLERTSECYIIVHGNNPEGFEINNISGFSNTVEVYDNEKFIGYTGITPLLTTPGNHTIKVKFNGMTMTRDIVVLTEENTQEVTFEFVRTTFDLWSKVPASDTASAYLSGVWVGASGLRYNGDSIAALGWICYVYLENFLPGGWAVDEKGHRYWVVSTGSFNGAANIGWVKSNKNISYTLHTDFSLIFNDVPGRTAQNLLWVSDIITENPIALSLYTESFSNWYLQYSNSLVDLDINIGSASLQKGNGLIMTVDALNTNMKIINPLLQTGYIPGSADKNGGGYIDLSHFSSIPYNI